MPSLLRRFRSSERAAVLLPPRTPIVWPTIRAEDTVHHPGALRDITKRRFDGMTITGAFDPAGLPAAVARFDGHLGMATDEPFGTMLGMPMAQIGNASQDRTPYLDDTERCRPLYRDAFGFEPHERLVEVLAPMADGLPLEPPVEDGRPYNPGNVRHYRPGMGGLRTHIGNEFAGVVGQGAFSHLLSVTQTVDHLSYFAILQRAENGGQLTVYDLLWEDEAPTEMNWSDGFRDDSVFDVVGRTVIDPGPGDLIVFGGGWRWHRIDPVSEPTPRITYGGFIAPSRDGSAWHMWS